MKRALSLGSPIMIGTSLALAAHLARRMMRRSVGIVVAVVYIADLGVLSLSVRRALPCPKPSPTAAT